MRRVTQFCVSRPKTVVAVWIVIFLACAPFALGLSGNLKAGGFNDPRGSAASGQAVAAENLQNTDSQDRLVVTLQDTDGANVTTFVPRVATAIQKFDHVSSVTDYVSQPQLLSADSTTTVFLVQFDLDNVQVQNAVPKFRDYLRDQVPNRTLETHVTGGPALDYDLNIQSQDDAKTAEFIAFPLLIIVLFLVFRAVVPTVITLLIAGVALALSDAFGFLLTQFTDVSVLYTNAVSLIGLAVATDYSLFVIRRYRSELAEDGDYGRAVRVAMSTAGHAVQVSGIAVVVALAALLIPRTIVFTSIAVGGMVVTAAAVLMSATLLPAVLTILGSKISWGSVTLPKLPRPSGKFRSALLASPRITALVLCVGFVALAVPLLTLKLQVPVASASILPEEADSRSGVDLAQAKVDARKLFPIQVVLSNDRDTDPSVLLKQINAVSDTARQAKGVLDVQSVASLPIPPAVLETVLRTNGAGLPEQAQGPFQQLWHRSSDGSTTAQVVVTASDLPDSEESHSLVRDLRNRLGGTAGAGTTVYVAGATAQGVDFDDLVIRSIPLIVLLVAILTFILLGIAFRSWLLPILSLILNGLVVAASMGLLTLLSQSLLGREINSVTPILVFAVMFGLSMDYMVIMISRMREHYFETGDHSRAVTDGLRSTAGLVNSAAIIMIAVFVSFLSAKISVVQQLGVGLAIAVFLDAFVVRMILLPAILRMFSGRVWGSRPTPPTTGPTESADTTPSIATSSA